ncbi:MAG: 1-acyl-sn-glycerol-3-phosphate acyltransferase, partial [Acidobacteria bacterium]|nr:1-acyl-sn-glycerol-3-phosphate acyltransferase [Acidobacteriota bacterium]
MLRVLRVFDRRHSSGRPWFTIQGVATVSPAPPAAPPVPARGAWNTVRSLLVTDPLIILSTILMGSVSLLVSLVDSSGRGQHRVARGWSRMLLAVSGVRVRVQGLEKIAPDGSYVFAANHRSYMDIPAILPHIPVQFRFLANRNLFNVPFIGYHLRRAGHLPVNNANPRESLRTMSDAARAIRQRGISALVFPEGGRTYGELGEFKEGAAYIAIKAGVPIVPMAMTGLREVLPRGSGVVNRGRV